MSGVLQYEITDKYVVIRGDRAKYSKTMLNAGGRWNSIINGWRFPFSLQDSILKLVANINSIVSKNVPTKPAEAPQRGASDKEAPREAPAKITLAEAPREAPKAKMEESADEELEKSFKHAHEKSEPRPYHRETSTEEEYVPIKVPSSSSDESSSSRETPPRRREEPPRRREETPPRRRDTPPPRRREETPPRRRDTPPPPKRREETPPPRRRDTPDRKLSDEPKEYYKKFAEHPSKFKASRKDRDESSSDSSSESSDDFKITRKDKRDEPRREYRREEPRREYRRDEPRRDGEERRREVPRDDYESLVRKMKEMQSKLDKYERR